MTEADSKRVQTDLKDIDWPMLLNEPNQYLVDTIVPGSFEITVVVSHRMRKHRIVVPHLAYPELRMFMLSEVYRFAATYHKEVPMWPADERLKVPIEGSEHYLSAPEGVRPPVFEVGDEVRFSSQRYYRELETFRVREVKYQPNLRCLYSVVICNENHPPDETPENQLEFSDATQDPWTKSTNPEDVVWSQINDRKSKQA